MKNNKISAFTLVELIVVITILAVLATVAFISFQWYSTESRDIKRMTDIATLSKWLQVYLAANSQVPEPSDTKTTITFSGSELLTQWYAGKSVLDTLRVKEATDPVDETFYTYSTNANNTKFQVLALLEKNQTAIHFMNNNVFADYTDRNIYSAGQSVWILLDETNTPIQELWSTSVDLQTSTDSFQTILSQNKVISQTGSNLKTQILWAQENLFWWRAFDPNCPIDDIHIWDQVWAGCNSTLGNGFEWGQLDSDIWTNNYNANIWNCYDYNGNNTWVCNKWDSKMLSNSIANNWFKWENTNGDREFQTIWWKLYTWDNAVNTACPVGWNVATNQDFTQLENFLYWSSCRNDNTWQCSGLWWKSYTNNSIAYKLQIPLSWIYSDDSWDFQNRWLNSHIWSPQSTTRYSRQFNSANETIQRHVSSLAPGFSVRCIKD